MIDLSGKTVLVTGATFGIGKVTALELARLKARVVLVGRDQARAAAAAAEIRAAAGNPEVSFLLADLSSLAQTRRLAAEFKSGHERLDVLVNNAGAMFAARETTSEGFERTWALNHLSYMLLTLELLDLLKRSRPARVVNVASNAHKGGSMAMANLQGEKNYSGLRAYAQSKLANIMFTFALSRRLEGTGVTANCLHPGAVATGFGAASTGWMSLLLKALRPFMLSPEAGAATTVWAASAPELAGVSGRYFVKKKAVAPSAAARDEAAQERLWSVSAEQLKTAAR